MFTRSLKSALGLSNQTRNNELILLTQAKTLESLLFKKYIRTVIKTKKRFPDEYNR